MKSSNPHKAGSYTYPVQFQMPVGMPGTFVHKGGLRNGCEAMIQYNLYVELYDDDGGAGRAWSPIVVLQRS